jgi:tetratricopeptide (TPR) repeat protein
LCVGLVGILTMGSAVTASQFNWMADFRKVFGRGGPTSLAFLENLPQEQRQTAEYHWALAQAFKAAAKPCPAAEAVATYGILPHENARDLAAVNTWLKAQSRRYLALSTKAKAAGNLKVALKAYLAAVKCDPSVVSKDPTGLKATASAAIGRLVSKDPSRPESQHLQGFFSYLFGDSATALRCFGALADLESDPYKKWRAQIWREWIRRESKEAVAKSALAAAVAAGAEFDYDAPKQPKTITPGR